jgi:hypothetical protein
LFKCVDFCASDTAVVYSHLEACLRLGFSFMFVIDFGLLVGPKRGPLSLVSSTEELFGRKKAAPV